jgi:S1-C subfamily serine protease
VLLLSFLALSGIRTTVYGQQLREAFRKVHQSVVTVRTKEIDVSNSSNQVISIIDGLGSGVLISADGKILTAAHVVQTADVAAVEFTDGQEMIARVIGSDMRSDVALLQLKTSTERHRARGAG